MTGINIRQFCFPNWNSGSESQKSDICTYSQKFFNENGSIMLKSLPSDKICFTNKIDKEPLLDTLTFGIWVHGYDVEDPQDFYKDISKGTLDFINFIDHYPTITNGKCMLESASHISKRANNRRINTAKVSIEQLNNIIDNPGEIKEFFGFNADTFGNHPSMNKIIKIIEDDNAGIIGKINDLLKEDQNKLCDSFSGKMKKIEEELAENIKKTGFGSWNQEHKDALCKKAASKIISRIAPKVILAGHSMGGYVVYAIALNPEKFDIANGLSTVMAFCSPLKSGVETPVPPVVAEDSFEILNQIFCQSPEKLRPQLAKNKGYLGWKEIVKNITKTSTACGAILASPYIYKVKKGVGQITQGSEFIKEYIDGKTMAEGISAISVYHPLDGYASDKSNFCLDDSVPNYHNLEVNIPITEEFIQKQRKKRPELSIPHLAHWIIPKRPKEFVKEFADKILHSPDYAEKMLDIRNSDGIRKRCLYAIYSHLRKNPEAGKDFFIDKENLFNKIKQVEEEKIPFEDSPSYWANKILSQIES